MSTVGPDWELDPILVERGCRVTLHPAVADPLDIDELLPGPHVVTTTDDGWTLIVAARPPGLVSAVVRFLSWACRIDVVSAELAPELVIAALRRSRPRLGAPDTLLATLCAASPSDIVPLAPAVAVDFSGWTRRDLASGPRFVADDGTARIEVHEACPPTQRSRRARAMASLRARPRASLDWFATAAGEVGARATSVSGDQIETVAWLAGDFVDVELHASAKPARFEETRRLVERLLNEYTFGLGDDRLRRFLYTPPPGWQGMTRAFVTDWFAPGYPNVNARITVQPAFPVAHHARHSVMERALRSAPPEAGKRIGPAREIETPRLRGRLLEHVERDRVIQEVLLRDERYYYPFRLDCSGPRAAVFGSAFRSLVESALPLARTSSTASNELFSGWID